MADDWRPGDLALCVREGVIFSDGGTHTGEGLRKGRIYTVEGVARGNSGAICLLVAGFGGRLAIRFRKIRPHVPDEEDRHTIALLNKEPEQCG